MNIFNKIMKGFKYKENHLFRTSIIPSILSVTHPEKLKSLHYFSIGEILGKNLFSPDQNCDTAFELKILDDPKKLMPSSGKQFSTYFNVTDDSIYYERKYIGLACKLLVIKINSSKTEVYVNPTYLRFVKFKMDNLYPVGVHLMDIFLIKTLRRGNLVIHGASLYNPTEEKAFLIIAPPDTGKTYTTAKLIEKGYKFLGEDLSYYQEKTDSLHCVPFTSTWGHHFSSKKIDITRIPLLGWFFTQNKKIVTDIFGSESVIKSAKLRHIYLIEKSDVNDIKPVQFNEEMLRKIMIIQRNEFSYFKNMLLRAYEYITMNIDIDKIMEIENKSIAKLLNSKKLFLVRGRNYSEFYKLILENERA